MPWTRPPCICPSTSIGLMTVPKSLTEECFTTSTTPVSGSISTSATWQPFGKQDGTGSLAILTSSVLGASSGSLTPACSLAASSNRPTERSVPAMVNRPLANSMSATAASSTWEAASLPCSTTLLIASTIAMLLDAAERDPAQLAALAAVALAPRKALPIGEFERVAEYGREIAGIVGLVGSRGVWDFPRLDEVAAAQFEPIDAHFPRRRVDQALHEIVALGAAGAPIGADIGSVREHALGRNFDQRRAIDADHVLHRIDGRRQRRDRAEISAHIAGAGEADRQEVAIGIKCKLSDLLMVAAMAVREET